VVAVFEPLRTTWTEPPQVHLEDIGRCKECAAYINHLCLFERTGWACSLCGCLNEYANAQNVRYLGGPSSRGALPELAPLPDIHAYSDTHNSVGTNAAVNPPYHAPRPGESRPSPATVVLLDASAGAELLDLFRNTLVSALEALPQGSRFGIATFVDEELVLYEPSANASEGGTPTFTAWHIPLVCPLIDNGHHDDQQYHHEEEGEGELDQVEPSVVDAVDVIPLHHFLTPVDSDNNKHQLAAMIESMLAELVVQSEPKDRKRPLGEAIQTLLRYLSTAGPTVAGSRLAVMLGGPPNHGRGSLACLSNRGLLGPNDNPPSDKSTSQSLPLDPYFPEVTAWGFPVSVLRTDPEDEDGDSNDNRYNVPDASKNSKMYSLRALAFYANAGAAAASMNVAIDVVAVLKTEKEQLDAIGDLLVNKSGGFLLCYDDDLELDECRLPQDWCKLLSQPSFGHSCTMRLRCSPELKVGPCLGGRLVQDTTYHDIFHVPRVHVHDTFGIELQLVASRGRQVIKSPPVVQLVVQYTCIDTLSASIQRRVHIMTAVIPLADTVLDVYASIDAEVSAWALFNSVRDALRLSSSPSSISELKQWIEKHLEARSSALKRWVGRLRDKRNVKEKAYGEGDGDKMIEQEYESFNRFMYYARAIYQRITLDNDDNGNLTCISETLPPMELATLLYPHLSRWSSPEEVSRQWLPLPQSAQSSLMDSMEGPWIYLVDSYSEIFIYYSKAAVAAHPYPPGRNSRIMSHATALRAARRMTPSLIIVQEGDDSNGMTAKQHVEKVLKKFCLM
jgi:hypothetical protein